jgi:hypothetical protein
MRSSLLEILDDGLSNFELDWILLDSASLRTLNVSPRQSKSFNRSPATSLLRSP